MPNELTPEQKRELDCWIAENVMGLVSVGKDAEMRERWLTKEINAVINRISYDELRRHYLYAVPKFTTSPADAMAVLQVCSKKVPLHLEVGCSGEHWFVGRPDQDASETVMASTLPLAICLFAKALYGKDGK